MKHDFSDIRTDYDRDSLLESHLKTDPFQQFAKWYKEHESGGASDPTAFTLSTVRIDGRPDSRVVLLKEISEGGFVFFTNYQSQKGKDLEANPFACLNFFWPEEQRQVRIRGRVEKVREEESSRYFDSRPRESRIGALTSNQSSEVPSRDFLEQRFSSLQHDYEGREIPRPDYWGGYRVIPDEIEFWQGRPSRLHDRILYSRSDSGWTHKRLAP
ncbi:MAG: pyridoxamine 5'-phosphate oxidase [Bacteroidota bacterium]|nr:pyridoxamine 5'-phosphate oxidase [Bacteroidota bacterium]MDX5428295.1 pyridoxamine 5'-phosphate oxidase [Bacteroidota bacterium]MDX5506077.1 pyridoxamine 5'-phosphate oxidase [Bacteroidota bacterium]